MSQDSNTILASRPLKEVYAVSRLVREAKGVLEGSFPLIWVEGEISNLAMPGSGHIYFTLKDEAAQVRCAMFRTRNRQLRFTPKNGMQVLLRVRVTLYEGRGEFQLVVEHMEEAGSGALQRAYEALRHRLGEEGLFDQAHKRALPTLPTRIGIISSPTGAAVHDILAVLKRRFPAVNIILYPVSVQGKEAAQQIIDALIIAEQRQECDVLILSRGGGSIEDLWSFNDEQLARTIFASTLPIISAVGHEVDFTIADFIADVRAPTPSAAAEIAVPNGMELLATIQNHCRRLNLLITHKLQGEQNKVNYLQQRLPQPQLVISQHMQTVDRLEQQLSRAFLQNINHKRQRLDYWSVRLKHPQAAIELKQHHLKELYNRLQQQFKQSVAQRQGEFQSLEQRLKALSPIQYIEGQQNRLNQHKKLLDIAIQQRLQQAKAILSSQMRTLSAVSPLRTLERGYSITINESTGDVVSDTNSVERGDHINVRLQQGHLKCEVIGVKHD